MKIEGLATILGIIVFFFLALFVYTKMAGGLPLSVVSSVTNNSDVFSVTGEGSVAVKPDMAYVTVGVNSTGATVKQAQTEINQVTSRITEALDKIEIDTDKDVKTINYSINPNYDWNNGLQKITGYSASSNLKIKIKNIELVNQVIDVSTANGANTVGGVVFDVEDKDKLEEEARKEAVEQAKVKAENVAKVAGFGLGRIIGYSEDLNAPVRPTAYGLESMKANDGMASTELQTGTSEIKVIVNINYEIK